MLGRILGETLEALTTGAFAGFFATWIPKIWKGLAEGASHPVVKAYIEKRMVSVKGLKDNHLFTHLLSIAIIPPAKKRQIESVFNQIEKINPVFAENARVIIAMDEIGRGTVSVEDKKAKTVTTTPDPNYKHPGLSILENLATCNNDVEMIAAIMAMGAYNEAPNGTLEELQIWAKKVALPNTLAFLNGAASKLGDGISALTNRVNQAYDDIELRDAAWDAMSLRQKLTPRNFWQKFMDLF